MITIVKRMPTTITIFGSEYKAEKRWLSIDARDSLPALVVTIQIIDPKYWEKYTQVIDEHYTNRFEAMSDSWIACKHPEVFEGL